VAVERGGFLRHAATREQASGLCRLEVFVTELRDSRGLADLLLIPTLAAVAVRPACSAVRSIVAATKSGIALSRRSSLDPAAMRPVVRNAVAIAALVALFGTIGEFLVRQAMLRAAAQEFSVPPPIRPSEGRTAGQP